MVAWHPRTLTSTDLSPTPISPVEPLAKYKSVPTVTWPLTHCKEAEALATLNSSSPRI
ncbi:hypothetical protein E2C01_078910 [Portunus trituberculatus]|uniref:Uncharacterized protein n=1 Tax=Portunus trituberculatus TaxID=210409 RepID=A0A5B7IK36_PORTR|nr:hypothetical protein [Portunus trituberculatus]